MKNNGKMEVDFEPLGDKKMGAESPYKEEQNWSEGMLWLFVWFSLNIVLTLMNKSFFQFYDFTFPITLSLIHMICSTALSYTTMRLSDIPVKSLSQRENISVSIL
jgi:hypothetical protein